MPKKTTIIIKNIIENIVIQILENEVINNDYILCHFAR
jgi:hypothetical protein